MTRQFPRAVSKRWLDGQLLLYLLQELPRHPGDLAQGVDRAEAVLALAVGDHAGRLCHGEAEIAELLEGRLVQVDLVVRCDLLAWRILHFLGPRLLFCLCR